MAIVTHLDNVGTGPLEYIDSKNKDDPRLEMINKNPGLREVIEWCLQRDIKKRPSADQLYQHAFFREYTTELDKCHHKIVKNFISRVVDDYTHALNIQEIRPSGDSIRTVIAPEDIQANPMDQN